MGGRYEFVLPCKLGEEFTSLKFVDWVDGERVYKEDKRCLLAGFTKGFLSRTDCYAKPLQRDRAEILSYGEYGKSFAAAEECTVKIDDKYFNQCKLSEWGFSSDRTGCLYGFEWENNFTLAHFILEPRYEHVYYAIEELAYGAGLSAVTYSPAAEEEHKRIRAERRRKQTSLPARRKS